MDEIQARCREVDCSRTVLLSLRGSVLLPRAPVRLGIRQLTCFHPKRVNSDSQRPPLCHLNRRIHFGLPLRVVCRRLLTCRRRHRYRQMPLHRRHLVDFTQVIGDILRSQWLRLSLRQLPRELCLRHHLLLPLHLQPFNPSSLFLFLHLLHPFPLVFLRLHHFRLF